MPNEPSKIPAGCQQSAEELRPDASATEGGLRHNTDPLVHSSFREALLVSGIWLVAMIWSVSVCYVIGYDRPSAELKLILGFPDWVFWGIVAPWTICTIASCAFAVLFVRDGDLGADLDECDELGLGG